MFQASQQSIREKIERDKQKRPSSPKSSTMNKQEETNKFSVSMNNADTDQLDGEDLVYNVPDGIEDDPEIIRLTNTV
jgi:hypothetical protein